MLREDPKFLSIEQYRSRFNKWQTIQRECWLYLGKRSEWLSLCIEILMILIKNQLTFQSFVASRADINSLRWSFLRELLLWFVICRSELFDRLRGTNEHYRQILSISDARAELTPTRSSELNPIWSSMWSANWLSILSEATFALHMEYQAVSKLIDLFHFSPLK
jgi:hypothetical protein